ncbi:hypothetical protein GCM10027168_07230 [Streptomyces capparidis]
MQPITAFPPSTAHPSSTLGGLLRRRASACPQARPYPGSALTLDRLHRRARAVAAGLGRAVPPGSRVLLACPKGEDFAGALFGCAMAGMVAVPLPDPGDSDTPAWSGGVDVASVERAVAGCAPAALLTAPVWSYQLGDLGGTRVVVADETHVDGEPAAALAAAWRPVGVLPTAGAYLRYAPGRAVEAEFTHQDVMATLLLLSRTARLGLDARHLGWLALVHGIEQAWAALLPVYRGSDTAQS